MNITGFYDENWMKNFYLSKIWSFRNDKVAKEKMEIEKKFEAFQREVKHTSKANTAKEIRVLKKVVQNLEVTSITCRNRYKHFI